MVRPSPKPTTLHRRRSIQVRNLDSYDLHDPATFSAFHATRIQLTEPEVSDLIARATANQRNGDYVSADLWPGSHGYFH